MVGNELRQYAKSLGFTEHDGMVYGEWDGYAVTIAQGGLLGALSGNPGGAFNVWVGARFARQEQAQALMTRVKDGGRRYRVLDQYRYPHGIRVNLGCSFGKLRPFLEFLMPLVAECEGLRPTRCPLCGQALGAGEETAYARMDGMAYPAHVRCIDHAAAAHAAEAGEDKHIGRGVAGAALGGLLGSIPWMVSFLFGFFVWIFGLIIGIGVSTGYKLAGGKPCRAKYTAVLLLTLCFSALCILGSAAVTVAVGLSAGSITGDFWQNFAALLSSEGYQNGDMQSGVVGAICALAGCAHLFDELRRHVTGGDATIRLP